eukprot:4794008-Prymnesium_polylepis.1
MICGDKQRFGRKAGVFLIDRFAQGHSTSCAQNTKQGESPAALESQPWDLVSNPGGARRPGENDIESDIGTNGEYCSKLYCQPRDVFDQSDRSFQGVPSRLVRLKAACAVCLLCLN